MPLTGATATLFETWVTTIVEGPQVATLLWDRDCLLGAGDALERSLSATVDGQLEPWTERVQVVRSLALARRPQATLEKDVAAAEAALRALTPGPGRGKRQSRDEATLQAAIASVGERHQGTGRLTVMGERQETTVPRDVGRGRGGPDRPTRTAVQGRDVVTGVPWHETALAARRPRLGWRVPGTTAPADWLSLPEAVVHEREGWSLERDFHLGKDRPWGLSPLLVGKEDQLRGLTRLLTLALRVLTWLETQVRRGLTQAHDAIAGLYEGQPTRPTDRPTGKRSLNACARAQITLTHAHVGAVAFWHLTPLAPLHEHLLRHLHVPASLYTALAHNSS